MKACGRTFSATSRSSLVSRARYTSPIPPSPILAMTEYGPRVVPRPSIVGDDQRHSERRAVILVARADPLSTSRSTSLKRRPRSVDFTEEVELPPLRGVA